MTKIRNINRDDDEEDEILDDPYADILIATEDDDGVDYSYPPSFITNRMQRWINTPKTVLLGKCPKDCVGDELLEPSLIMLVKQVESFETSLLQEHERQSYWDMLGLRKT